MRSRWERSTRNVVVLRPVLSAVLGARRPHGAARAERPVPHGRRPARASEWGSLGADLVAVAAREVVAMAGVMVAVARVLEVVGAMPEARAKALPRAVAAEVVAVEIAIQLAARAELVLLAVALARPTLTPAVGRAIRCGGYHFLSCGSSSGVATW
eukprot:5815441-Pleurochrysis_carterae.AAC.1